MASVGVFTRPMPMTPLTPRASSVRRRRAGQRQIEDLVGLLPRDGGLVQ